MTLNCALVNVTSFDSERWRERYVLKRATILQTIRAVFGEAGYTEVETPSLQIIPGGASARPFITHFNALNIDMYMRIATELYLKRLIVGGFEGVYEIGKNFRNEGMDKTIIPNLLAWNFMCSIRTTIG